MPIKVSPVAGCRFYIGSAPINLPDFDAVEADFAAVTWIEVGNYETMGSAGDGAQNIATNLINRRRTINQKGSRQAPQRSDNFALNLTDPGQIAMVAAEQTDYNYPFRVDMNDAPVPKSATVTISVATPGVVSWIAHGLPNGTAVKFTTTGTLPTGLTAGTTYYVVNTATDSFSIAATPGGSAINTTGAGTGTNTATSVPSASKRLFIGQVQQAEEGNGGANSVQMLNCSVLPNTNYVKVAALG